MNKWLVGLVILLIAQLALAAILHQNTNDYAAYQAQEKLLDFDIKQVDRFDIHAPEAHLILRKAGDQWLLPEHDEAIAKTEPIDAMLNKLGTLKKGWPVAKTSHAAIRFKVNEDTFERKLVMFRGEQQLGELLIGTSPGLRQSHARRPGESEIYKIKFDAWQASVKQEDWLKPPPKEEKPQEAQ